MMYFAGQILLLLLFTIPLWFGIGWWVSSLERAKAQKARESEWAHHLNTLRRDRDKYRDEVEKAHGQIRILQNRRADGKSPPKTAALDDEERHQYKRTITDTQHKLDATDRKMLGFSQQVENLHQQNLEREDILNQLRDKLETTSEALRKKNLELERVNASSNFQTVDALSKLEELQNVVLSQEQTITELKASTDKDGDSTRVRELETVIQNQDRMIAELNRRMQVARKVQSGDVKAHVSHLETVISDQDKTIARLRTDNQQMHEALDNSETEQMHEAMLEQETIITQLRRVLDKATKQNTATRKKPRYKDPSPMSGDLFATTPDPAESQTTASPSDADIAELSMEADPDEADEPVNTDIKLYSGTPDRTDNLKKIRGIGPAFERTLNRLGIYTYAQIASWSASDTEWVARKIHSFADRIVKGEWVEQARELEAKK